MKQAIKLFSEDTHLSEEAFALYIDALRLNKIYLLPGAILRHVADCQECKSAIVESLSLVGAEAYGGVDPHPYLINKTGLHITRFSMAYRIAAVVLIGVSLGSVLYFFRMAKSDRIILKSPASSTQMTHLQSQKDQVKEEDQVRQQNDYADNFSVSPNLENLVNAELRSASFVVLSPANGEVEDQQILFQWKSAETEPVILRILSNKEKVVKNISVKKARFLFAGKLNPGLYYWEIENKDELLYVGKFLVK